MMPGHKPEHRCARWRRIRDRLPDEHDLTLNRSLLRPAQHVSRDDAGYQPEHRRALVRAAPSTSLSRRTPAPVVLLRLATGLGDHVHAGSGDPSLPELSNKNPSVAVNREIAFDGRNGTVLRAYRSRWHSDLQSPQRRSHRRGRPARPGPPKCATAAVGSNACGDDPVARPGATMRAQAGTGPRGGPAGEARARPRRRARRGAGGAICRRARANGRAERRAKVSGVQLQLA